MRHIFDKSVTFLPQQHERERHSCTNLPQHYRGDFINTRIRFHSKFFLKTP